MHEVTRRIEWDMGHRVPLHDGKCKTPHGHRYAAEITVAGPVGAAGFVVDFGVIKSRVGQWIDACLDHTTAYQRGDKLMEAMAAINDSEHWTKPFYAMDAPPTAEKLAELIYRKAEQLLPDLRVVGVTVWETPNCGGRFFVAPAINNVVLKIDGDALGEVDPQTLADALNAGNTTPARDIEVSSP